MFMIVMKGSYIDRLSRNRGKINYEFYNENAVKFNLIVQHDTVTDRVIIKDYDNTLENYEKEKTVKTMLCNFKECKVCLKKLY